MRRFGTICLLLFLCLWIQAQDIERRDTLAASHVTGDKTERTINSTQTGLQILTGEKINRGFALFNSPDIIKTLQALPGVASGTELTSGLYVHGGDGTDNLFLLDGVPIYQVSHLIGLFSAFNADVVESVEFYKSGFPARYGGRASSVVDIRTRDGDFNKLKGNFSLGLIDGRLQMEGPLSKTGNTSFNFSLRRTWMDVITRPLMAYVNARSLKEYGSDNSSKYNVNYNFTDLNFRITHKFAPGNTLRLNFFTGGDRLPAHVTDKYVYQYENELEGKVTDKGESESKLNLYWGNLLGSLSWEYDISPNLSSNVTAYASRNTGNIMLSLKEKDTYNDKLESSTSITEAVKAGVLDGGLTATFFWNRLKCHNVKFGAAAMIRSYHPERSAEMRMKQPYLDTAITSSGGSRFHSLEADLFAEDEIKVTPWFNVNVGLRYCIAGGEGKTWNSLEPRVAMKFQCGLNTSIRASYADMSQFNHQVSTSYLDLPTNTWLPSTAVIKPMRSHQVAAGVYTEFLPGLKGSLEGWFKTMDHMYEYCGSNMLYPAVDKWESEFTQGRGRSWGMEVSLEYENDRLYAAAYYTLAWSQRKFDALYFDWFRDRNDNRHKFTVSANCKITKNWDAYVAWNYHTGNRITVGDYVKRVDIEKTEHTSGEDMYRVPNNLELPAYHRMDLGMNFHKQKRKGREAIWNLSVYNVYCRMNAIFGYLTEESVYNPKTGYYEYTGRTVGSATGLIPIIPTVGYTLKF